MTVIKKLRSLRGAGVLADRTTKDQGPTFLRHNLIYGFNGSGKSTLSRLMACLQTGRQREEMPKGCTFEIEMDDGTVFASPDKLAGLEARVCVFNTDFVERNLRWAEGRANSIFYISEEQSEVASELHEKQALLEVREAAEAAQGKAHAQTEKELKTYRTERARLVSSKLHLQNRHYEAPQLKSDYDKLSFEEGSVLSDRALDDLEEVVRQSAPPPALQEVDDTSGELDRLVEAARSFGELSISRAVLDEIEEHPTMVPWLKTGHDYHTTKDLQSCLFCGNDLTAERKAKLAAALDDKLSRLLLELRQTQTALSIAVTNVDEHLGCPSVAELGGALRSAYDEALNELSVPLQHIKPVLAEADRIIAERSAQPTMAVTHSLPSAGDVAKICQTLSSRLAAVNVLIGKHNTAAVDFESSQSAARLGIRKHFLAEGSEKYRQLEAAVAEARREADAISSEVRDLRTTIANLSAKVRKHGPAADKITKLVQAYLGHGELTIFAADEGYELHRHHQLVQGPPSEGEKTAIALCYFLSTLEAEGRSTNDLIVVVDDPISSLDTKAMNYACSLIRARIEGAAQVFVLTHNQNCMNEFKKAWQRRAKGKGDRPPTATLLFIDVAIPEGSERRVANIVEMPKQLKGYDSEYHFLCSMVMEFEAAGAGYSEHWFMMPNVIRRVLDVFLGFKEPGSHSIEQKLDALAQKHPQLDPIRLKALHRLVQVESHSDSLDELITHSSMTIEEARDANTALLAVMEAADPGHVAAMRHQCGVV